MYLQKVARFCSEKIISLISNIRTPIKRKKKSPCNPKLVTQYFIILNKSNPNSFYRIAFIVSQNITILAQYFGLIKN